MLVSNSAFTIRGVLSPDRPSRLPCVFPTSQTRYFPARDAAYRDNHRSPGGSGQHATASPSSTVRPAPEFGSRRDQQEFASFSSMIYDINNIYQSGENASALSAISGAFRGMAMAERAELRRSGKLSDIS